MLLFARLQCLLLELGNTFSLSGKIVQGTHEGTGNIYICWQRAHFKHIAHSAIRMGHCGAFEEGQFSYAV